MSIPKLYARKEIPVDKEEIVTPDKIKEWKHLRLISNKTVQRDDIQAGLLIGANCMKALERTKIIPSEGGGSYTYKARLGWCVVEQTNCISKGITASCNRVAVRDVASLKLASHHFAMEKSVKNVNLKGMFQAMYRLVFSEPELVVTSTMLKYDEVLRKDKTFMEIVDRGTFKKDDHNAVPLPFCDPNLILLNNKKRPI